MASILPGYEYDIFISYRQKDNKGDHWVTEFVNALKTELESAFKEDISIYFDSNPHDGLLETHNVNKSLEGKLKCLIFIPIISQTYCDTKSFAWQHEFVAFNKLAKGDLLGRDIRLSSGNVASRILPIKIHDLDATDKALLENELGGVLRSVEFIYKEPGVNRPLKSTDSKTDNQNKTDYRNQVNKVANAIKELITAIQSPGGAANQAPTKTSSDPVSVSARRKFSLAAAFVLSLGILGYALIYFTGIGNKLFQEPGKSIAVIPFTNMNNNPEQDYLSDGIAEDILNHLVKIEDLQVKSRTSTLQYKNTQKNIKQIGEELGVSSILEGSVRKAGDKIRIVVQLIDVNTDVHLWSETYDRDIKDVFAMQSEIALEIANVLRAKLSPEEKTNIAKPSSTNATAYDYYLRARQIARGQSVEKSDFKHGLFLVDQAIALDPKFSQAYALKADLLLSTRYIGLTPTWKDSSLYYAARAIALDPMMPDGYLERGIILNVLGHTKAARDDFAKAFDLAPNNSDVIYALGSIYLQDGNKKGADMVLKSIDLGYTLQDPNYYIQWINVYWLGLGDLKGAQAWVEKLRVVDPSSWWLYVYSSGIYREEGNFEKSIEEGKAGVKLNPDLPFISTDIGWAYYLLKKYDKAEECFYRGEELEKKQTDSTLHYPWRHRLGMAKLKLGKKEEAKKLFEEQARLDEEVIQGKRSHYFKGTAYYDGAAARAALGNKELAMQYLDSAYSLGMNWYWGYQHDPLFESMREMPAYKKLMVKLKTDRAFRKEAFEEAIARLKASKELKGLLEK